MLKKSQVLRVLVVDDEPIIADTLVTILNKNGFEATAAYNGALALKAALQLNPDVLIVDVVMAGMNGLDTAICIREAMPGCRVILFSGLPRAEDMVRRAQADGHPFEMLSKPLPPQVIIDHLKAPAREMALIGN